MLELFDFIPLQYSNHLTLHLCIFATLKFLTIWTYPQSACDHYRLHPWTAWFCIPTPSSILPLFSYNASNNRKLQVLSSNLKLLIPFHKNFSGYTCSSCRHSTLEHTKIWQKLNGGKKKVLCLANTWISKISNCLLGCIVYEIRQ